MITAISDSVTGETIAKAENGVAIFTCLIGMGVCGSHNITFTSDGLASTNTEFVIQEGLNSGVEDNAEKGCQVCP